MEHTPEEGVVIERKEEITFLKEPVLDSNTGDAQGDVMVGQVVPFVRKEIPPKKDRMDPLKIDMSKPISMPHTCKPTVAFSCCLCGVAFKSAKTMLQHMKHKHSQQREAELNNTVSAGEQLKDGEIMKSQTETCEPIQVLGNMDTFEQGQGLQVIETLGQEQMQQLIETLGQEQTVEHVAIVVQEQLEEQHEDACEQKQPTELELTQKDIATVEEQQVHFGTIELTQAQGQIKDIDMEQAHLHMDTLELELTQDHIETIVLTPVEGHEEAFLLDQTNEQTQRVETEQSPSEEDKAEQANGQVQTEELQHTDGQVGVQLELTQEQVHSGELEQRQPETVQLEQIQGEMEMVELKQIQILEQTETQVIEEQGKTQKPMGEGQEENTACDRLEDIQDLSEKTKELQEKTSAQQEKIDECEGQGGGEDNRGVNGDRNVIVVPLDSSILDTSKSVPSEKQKLQHEAEIVENQELLDTIGMSLSPECRKEQGLPGTDCEEDGQMTETQTKPQNPQELADFLLQNSEAEDSEGNSDSEPEEEACVLARYNEGRRGLANSDKSSRSDQDFNRILPGHSEQAEMSAGNNKESKGEKTPIDYFTSYLDWDTWEEIACCNTAWSESPIPVTAKEMAQFVGIHIAMGTLKVSVSKCRKRFKNVCPLY
ncbi:hypothetical protein Z043_103889 [Scleropages formosus]|uniref:C2H2-type domain-containing protein n=1 Tax=Scleropages formosus TaxID=113540 RepID=A0A0P7UQJ2_SCLFO|nr:hypothetical protein Z043_103889 [Scleropages formosus]